MKENTFFIVVILTLQWTIFKGLEVAKYLEFACRRTVLTEDFEQEGSMKQFGFQVILV